jgi:hypothetical protein
MPDHEGTKGMFLHDPVEAKDPFFQTSYKKYSNRCAVTAPQLVATDWYAKFMHDREEHAKAARAASDAEYERQYWKSVEAYEQREFESDGDLTDG